MFSFIFAHLFNVSVECWDGYPQNGKRLFVDGRSQNKGGWHYFTCLNHLWREDDSGNEFMIVYRRVYDGFTHRDQ